MSWPATHDLVYPGEKWTCPITGVTVPKSPKGNAAARRHLLKNTSDPAVQRAMVARCGESLILWLNLWGWTYVTKKYGPDGRQLRRTEFAQHQPFITWPVQDAAIAEIQECIDEGEDVIIDKSRQMGLSWLLAAISTWYWLFVEDAQIGVCSRVEDDVDKPGVPKSFMYKVDYILGRLPLWMLPCPLDQIRRGGQYRTHLKLQHPGGATIHGESSTEDQFRGATLTFAIFDEMAAHDWAEAGWHAAADATGCRIGNSTPIGPGTEYTRQRNQGLETGSPRVVGVFYHDHPDKGRGREQATDEDGAITGISGRRYWDSPWFRAEVARRQSAKSVAQDILADHATSGDLFFSSVAITNHMRDSAREPVRCEIAGDVLVPDPKGRWYVFAEMIEGRVSQKESYVMFCDIAHGNGSSNSACAVLDDAGSLVAMFADPHIGTYDYADEICNAGKGVFRGWRDMAFLGYEVNGPGEGWHRDLLRNEYKRIYFRRATGKRTEKRSKDYGWRSGRREKMHLLRGLGRAFERGDLTIPCRATLSEMLEYVIYDDGSVGPGLLRDEVTGARDSHGDRVIALAGAVLMRAEEPKFDDAKVKHKPGTWGEILDLPV